MREEIVRVDVIVRATVVREEDPGDAGTNVGKVLTPRSIHTTGNRPTLARLYCRPEKAPVGKTAEHERRLPESAATGRRGSWSATPLAERRIGPPPMPAESSRERVMPEPGHEEYPVRVPLTRRASSLPVAVPAKSVATSG